MSRMGAHPLLPSGATVKAKQINARAGRTASKEVRRRQLIEATIESIARYGISGTTMTTVTDFAGLSVGIVNFYFDSKKNLFDETLRHLADEHRDLWSKTVDNNDQTAAAKLLAIVDAEFHPKICTRKKLAVWSAFYGEVGYPKYYREIMLDIDTARWKTSARLCREIILEGAYVGIDAEDVAETLEGLFDGFSINILIYPRKFTRNDAKDRVRSYLASTFPKHFDRPSKVCSKE